MKKNTIYTKLILAIGIVVLINVLSDKFNFRLDLTKEKRFTLSEGTKRIVQDLEDVVTIKAYVSEDVDADIDNMKRELENHLREYNELSNGNIVVEYITPDLDDKEEVAKIEQEGIQPQQSNQMQTGELSAKIYFFGLTIEYGSEKELIPFIQPRTSLEYPISKAIKKLTFTNKPKVGFITGNGEADLTNLQYITEELKVNFEPIGIDMSKDMKMIDETDVLVIINPKDSITPEQVSVIDKYFESGKSVFLTYSNTTADVFKGNGMAGDANNALEAWVERKGVSINEDLVHDLSCFDPSPFPGDEFYYFPNAQNFADHPITKGLGEVAMFLTSTLQFTGSEGSFTPLIFTGERSGVDVVPTAITNRRNWTDADFTSSNLTVVGLYEKGNGKLLVAGCGDFLNLNQETQRMIKYGNLNLVVNALDFMSGIDDLAEARTKIVTLSKFDKPESEDTLRYMNFLLPVVLVILYGFLRSRARKAKRLKWRNMN